VLTYKRLESGQFAWPQVRDGVMRLSDTAYGELYTVVR
jgi:transposase